MNYEYVMKRKNVKIYFRNYNLVTRILYSILSEDDKKQKKIIEFGNLLNELKLKYKFQKNIYKILN